MGVRRVCAAVHDSNNNIMMLKSIDGDYRGQSMYAVLLVIMIFRRNENVRFKWLQYVCCLIRIYFEMH